jgi:site-specific recombinase XerD
MEAQEYWLSELSNRRETTKKTYKEFFSQYLAFTGKTPDQLIQERKVEIKSDDIQEQRHAESMLKAFVSDLLKKGKSVSTVQIAYAAIRSFYEMHYSPLRMRRGDFPQGECLGSRAATKNHLKAIFANVKKTKDAFKVKAILMTLKDSGLRVSDARALKYGQIQAPLEKGETFIPLTLITKKNRTTAKTFLGPEAVEAIKAYLDERRKGTRRIEPEVLKAESPLFRTNENYKIKHIGREGFSTIVRFQCQAIGEKKLSAHSFRKYFQTQLEAAGTSTNWIDQMIGHRLINSRDAYSLPSDEQLLEAYKNAYSQLRVYPDKNEVEERVTQLEKEIVDRNTTIAELFTNGKQKAEELQELKARLVAIEKMIREGLKQI